MFIVKWLLIGLIAGSFAKMLTPQEEKGGWLSSLGIGVAGSVVGGFIGNLVGLRGTAFLGDLIIAFIGSVVLLVIYYRFFSNHS